MTFEEAANCPFNPFDLTKVWPQKDYPLIPCGKFVLNRNPRNYFAEVEQAAYSPASMIPGVEPSPDKMLQGRLFSYPDTHRHRLGGKLPPDSGQLPVQGLRKELPEGRAHVRRLEPGKHYILRSALVVVQYVMIMRLIEVRGVFSRRELPITSRTPSVVPRTTRGSSPGMHLQ